LIPTADGRRSSSPPKRTRVRCAAAVIGSSRGCVAWSCGGAKARLHEFENGADSLIATKYLTLKFPAYSLVR
jgi:hypothetical protein